MKLFFIGIAVATLSIIVAEIGFDYSLGDLLKDFAIRIFKGAEAKLQAQYSRAQNRYQKLATSLQARLAAIGKKF